MSTAAPKTHLRYGELELWLRENGISRRQMEKMVAERVIKPVKLAWSQWNFYNAAQVKRDVLDKMDVIALEAK